MWKPTIIEFFPLKFFIWFHPRFYIRKNITSAKTMTIIIVGPYKNSKPNCFHFASNNTFMLHFFLILWSLWKRIDNFWWKISTLYVLSLTIWEEVEFEAAWFSVFNSPERITLEAVLMLCQARMNVCRTSSSLCRLNVQHCTLIKAHKQENLG